MKIANVDSYIAGGYISQKQMWDEFVNDCGKNYLTDGAFEISDTVLEGCRLIGDFLQLPQGGIRVTSSYRPATSFGDCNKKAGGASKSQHKTGNAIDIQFKGSGVSNSESLDAFWDEMMCKGQLFQDLQAIGIKGIGAYSSFIHIDDGQNPENIRTSLQGWDSSRGNGWSTSYINSTENYKCGSPKRDTTGLEDYIGHITDPEDGDITPKGKAFSIVFYSTIALIFLAMIVVGIFNYRKKKK
jgi:uncharacterized protein YcbK (DUF882 family)